MTIYETLLQEIEQSKKAQDRKTR